MLLCGTQPAQLYALAGDPKLKTKCYNKSRFAFTEKKKLSQRPLCCPESAALEGFTISYVKDQVMKDYTCMHIYNGCMYVCMHIYKYITRLDGMQRYRYNGEVQYISVTEKIREEIGSVRINMYVYMWAYINISLCHRYTIFPMTYIYICVCV